MITFSYFVVHIVSGGIDEYRQSIH